ncbi:MAG: Fe-S cluster assembly protein SufD [unclassified Hahellaceae]|nr:Fe-S cluster assembly protein SufD [Hahellaceae bacterium]|tara:strand:+ start:46918 stop:48369 length:1452 start_codon:yes stop_codon:yes gene_type:complete
MSAELTQTSQTELVTGSADGRAQPLSLPDDLRDWLVEEAISRSAGQDWSSAGERFRQIQTDAVQALKTTPFPTRKTESWRYTSVQPLIAAINGTTTNAEPKPGSREAQTAPQAEALQTLIDQADLVVHLSDTGSASLECRDNEAAQLLSFRLNQTSGQALESQSEAPGLLAQFGDRVPEGYFPFVSANAALLSSCLEIQIAASTGSSVVKPRILLLNGDKGGDQEALSSKLHSRVLVSLARDAQAELTEVRIDSGSAPVFATSVLEASLEANSVLQHYQFTAAGVTDCLYSAAFVKLGDHANYAFNGGTTGSALSRNDLTVELTAPGAYAALNAHMLLNGSSRCDYHTALEHMAPHCESDEQVRTIVSDKGKAVFNGRIHIHRDAQKTRAEMNNRNLLMSPQAEVNTKPELEIYADDVKCAHGATIGQLDANAVFYCKSRGIDEQSARSLLSEAFIVETIQLMPATAQQDFAMALLQRFQETV